MRYFNYSSLKCRDVQNWISFVGMQHESTGQKSVENSIKKFNTIKMNLRGLQLVTFYRFEVHQSNCISTATNIKNNLLEVFFQGRKTFS